MRLGSGKRSHYPNLYLANAILVNMFHYCDLPNAFFGLIPSLMQFFGYI